MNRDDINKGFQIDEPNAFIPWDIDENGLRDLLEKHSLKKVADGYYCISCRSLGGLPHELGFHFEIKPDEVKMKDLEDYVRSIGKIIKKIGPDYDPKKVGRLKELEFFRKSYPNLKESFDNFQHAFEEVFGKPTTSKKGEDGYYSYHEWNLKGVKISHYVIDRFGPEEHMRIKKV